MNKTTRDLPGLAKRYALFLVGLFIASMGVAFGYLTDLSCRIISGISPQTYPAQFLFMLAGCVILAFGIWIQFRGAVAMLPGEAMNRAISRAAGLRYENVKIFFDIAYIAVSAVVCLVFLGELRGVREGSIIAAVSVGVIIRFYNMIFDRLTGRGAAKETI